MLQDTIKNELDKLYPLKQKVKKSLSHAPKGSMRCSMARGKYPQFYQIREDQKGKSAHGRFMRKTEKTLIQRYAQKEYDQKVWNALTLNEKLLEKLQEQYNSNFLYEIYYSLPLAKRNLVNPYELSQEDFIKKWYEANPSDKNSYPIEKPSETERGEIVRSKSEKTIADKLFHKNIPYQYETCLRLENYRVIYPDFTILNVRTRKTFYLEHFGMMDNPEYCKKALEKIEIYEKNGIYQGESLLITMESSLKAISNAQIDSIIDRFLL